MSTLSGVDSDHGILNVPVMYGSTVPSLRVTCAVIVWTPLTLVFNGFALVVLPPAKSNGLLVSVRLGDPVGLLGFGSSSQNLTFVAGFVAAVGLMCT
jgi:hypothetical protein